GLLLDRLALVHGPLQELALGGAFARWSAGRRRGFWQARQALLSFLLNLDEPLPLLAAGRIDLGDLDLRITELVVERQDGRRIGHPCEFLVLKFDHLLPVRAL